MMSLTVLTKNNRLRLCKTNIKAVSQEKRKQKMRGVKRKKAIYA
jgi:hypothetical protein